MNPPKLTAEGLAYLRAVEEARLAIPTRQQMADELGVSKSLIDHVANNCNYVADSNAPRGTSKYSQQSPEQRLKDIARSIANMAVRRGHLVKKPCEKCGKANAEKHHDDYSKPLDVRWLCMRCHREEHADQAATKLQVELQQALVELGLAER